MSKYSIGIIVTWFGILPPYFSAWLISAEANKDIDFLIFTDCEIKSSSSNIFVYKTTLEHTLEMFKKKLNRDISITNSYKFCDCRPFFGITYEDYLKDYDFWGYCDIDLVFGDIHSFITDEKLDRYDRFYQYGHLSIFRNNDKMNHLYDLPGGIYSYDEIFKGKAKCTPEEHFGINRICERNKINWYTNVDFVDFAIKYPKRLEAKHGMKNYSEQIFCWQDRHAFRLYREGGVLHRDEFVYMHWQKRKPNLSNMISGNSILVITGDQIEVLPENADLKTINYMDNNPPLSDSDKKVYARHYNRKKIIDFLRAPIYEKRIWMRQKRYKLTDGRRSYL